MLQKKKTYNPEEYDVGVSKKNESKEIDFSGIIVNAMQMGFTYKESLRLRLGEFSDYFESYKLIHNMKMNKSVYKMPERRVSMLDL